MMMMMMMVVVIKTITTNLAIGRGDLSLTSCHGDHSSISGLSMWNLWWIKWHWDKLLSQYLGSSLPVIPPVLNLL